MKNIYKALCFVILATVLVACPKDDSTSFVIRERQEVYDENILSIEDYLKENYLVVDGDMNAEVKAIDAGQTSIWDQTTYQLESMTVRNDSRVSVLTDGLNDDVVDYKVYYIKLNEGGGVTPNAVDSVFTAYKGWNLSNVVFDENIHGTWSSFPESNVSFISGYRQILSKIKTEGGSPTDNGDGTFSRVDYGNVIVFIPSGLAYFNQSRVNISQYGSICFQIKLFTSKERDHDKDRIMSKDEDIDGDGNYFNDDTDGDKLPDFFDLDDDGDRILTKTEIIETNDGNGNITYYSYSMIPICPTLGKRVHLDPSPNCQ